MDPLRKESEHWKVLEQIKLKLQNLVFVDKDCERIEDVGLLSMFQNYLFKIHFLQQAKYKQLPKQSRKPWFVSGWLLNIESIKLIFENLSEQYGFDLLPTRALNQDPIENFFGVVRMKNMTNNRPDPCRFISAYRSACMNQLLKRPEKANCEQDNGINLLNLKDFLNANIIDQQAEEEHGAVSMNQSELEEFDLAQVNCISYTAGWITRSIKHKHCLLKINNDDRAAEDHSILNLNRSYGQVSQKLEVFLQEIARAFKDNFQKLLSLSNIDIKEKITEYIIQQESSSFLCETCMRQVCDKYVNMLMKGELRKLNNTLKKSRTRKNKTAASEKAKKLNIVRDIAIV